MSHYDVYTKDNYYENKAPIFFGFPISPSAERKGKDQHEFKLALYIIAKMLVNTVTRLFSDGKSKKDSNLKLVSAIFCQTFISHQMIALQKL